MTRAKPRPTEEEVKQEAREIFLPKARLEKILERFDLRGRGASMQRGINKTAVSR
jgi:hypothetical protein